MRLFTTALFLALLLCVPLRAAEVPLDVKQSSLKFTGHAFMHDFHGEAKEFSGTAQVDPRKPELVTSAKIDIAAAKMTTFEDTRDKNMFDWLHVDVHPSISFELTRVLPVEGTTVAATKDHPARYLVSGSFILNQIPTPLQTPASVWREGNLLIVTGTTTINTAAHGLPIVKKLFLTVDKEVDIAFRLVFDLPPKMPVPAKQ